jgi:hypothetical protein
MDEKAAVVIGDEGGQHVAIRLLWRSHPKATDYWDGNWIESEIHVRAGGFTGTYRASLRSEEFVSFHRDLKTLERTLAGKATFNTMEGQLGLSVEGDGRGHVVLKGVALDQAGSGNALHFELELDQTYLPGILRGLDEALAQFPVVGRPDTA